ncbi:carbohydrate kinase [Neorhizobium sp. NCHU2750]|uniref:carbohydrate kinase n=1 Tax=Neorhizobium sp. NCHU2750 TaxID=1825976 RepID=UPI000E7125FB|nr:carbohydrate kinase [Neorhizobium sp. NCHU2750]
MTQPLAPQEAAVLAMIRNNPFVGQQEIATALGLARSTVAAHIAQLMTKGHILGRGYMLASEARAVCIGGAVLDRKYHARGKIVLETSNPVDSTRSLGGVARNVAENLARLGSSTGFISIIGDDDGGHALLKYMRDIGIDVSQAVITGERPTAEYAAILDAAGDLVLGIADMSIFDLFQPEHIDRAWPHLAAASWVFADCNLSADALSALISRRKSASCRLAIDAVSTHKVIRLPQDLNGIDLIFMNIDEAAALLGRSWMPTPEGSAEAALALQQAGAAMAVVSAGARGMAVAGIDKATFIPAVKAQPVDMTGAGDAMIAATLHRLLEGDDIFAAARIGTLAATLTTECETSVHPDLSADFIDEHRHRFEI